MQNALMEYRMQMMGMNGQRPMQQRPQMPQQGQQPGIPVPQQGMARPPMPQPGQPQQHPMRGGMDPRAMQQMIRERQQQMMQRKPQRQNPLNSGRMIGQME